ncbi:MAG: hypothetical protein KJ668_22585, partial [Proteobacteria bacterium]|nr:hypothetical protein [Pseudomonadota bacterium]
MNDIAPDVIYRQTENALIKEIEDELIITILKNEGFQSSDNLIYTTNKTGSVIWKRIDGQTKLK